MNAKDILMYGNRTVMMTIADVPDHEWETEGVCGVWSVKEIIAHLASFEHVLVEVLDTFDGKEPGPHLKSWGKSGQNFNDVQVAKRKGMTSSEVLKEYESTHTQSMKQIALIPPETLRQVGTIPWYGAEYALDDLIVYAFYGHKREHCSQINVFKDELTGK
ncbi:MAG TPA: DinB family protein [candidate division Zixibacteria bacterium]|nr:DinB family protein [candidate division Zixibacteria bacterium]